MKNLRRIFWILVCLSLLAVSRADWIPEANAQSTMTASEDCVAFIKSVEGFSAKPYYDYSQHTVGYGTRCPDDKYFEYYTNGIPRAEAEALLRETLAEVGDDINEKLLDRYNLSVTQYQFDALVSFSFNIGTSWMTYDSTLRNAILRDAGEEELVYAFSLYSTAGGNYSTGLISRRLCEANMYINGIYSQTDPDAYGYVLYEPNGGTLTYRVQGFVCGKETPPVADAVRSGDTFLGWYTDLTGGTKVTGLSEAVSGKTLFARWQSADDAGIHDSPSVIVTVTGDVVNIRNGPGTNYGIATQVRRNAVLVVSHVTKLTDMTWGKVQGGWICLDYTDYNTVVSGPADTTPEEAPTPPETDTNPGTTENETVIASGTVRVNDLLRIRSGPGTTYATVGYLGNGQKVDILEQKTTDSMVWGRIARGWISMDYVVTGQVETLPPQPETSQPAQPETQIPAPEQPPTEPSSKPDPNAIEGVVTTEALRVRSGPSTENTIVGFYYRNAKVYITETLDLNSVRWGKTDLGWISLQYVRILSQGQSYPPASEEPTSPAPQEPTQPSQGQKMTVIADCLRVRKEPTTASKIAELLYRGDEVVVFETRLVDNMLWGRVENGWVAMDYVR